MLRFGKSGLHLVLSAKHSGSTLDAYDFSRIRDVVDETMYVIEEARATMEEGERSQSTAAHLVFLLSVISRNVQILVSYHISRVFRLLQLCWKQTPKESVQEDLLTWRESA